MDTNFNPRRQTIRIFLFLLLTFLIFSLAPQLIFSRASFPSPQGISATPFQEEKPEEFLPGPGFLEKAANFLYLIYDYIKKAVIFLLEKTIFQGNPKLASFYGEVATFLASLTAIYLLLLLIASARKIVGVVLLLGWAFFIVAIVIRGS